MDVISTSGKMAHEIKAIVNSFLHNQCINCFSHSRIFADGSRAELWSDPFALEHTYLKTNYTIRTHAPNLYDKNERYFFLKDKIEQFTPNTQRNYQFHLQEQREFFNHDNIFIMRGDDALCTELFCFYGPVGNLATKLFCMNNIQLLYLFIKYFKKKSQKYIKLAEEDRIVKPWRKHNMITHPQLTARERDVAQQMTYYKTAKQIAALLGIKNRTVEGYIINIKDKYLCNKKSELIKLLRQDPNLFNTSLK